MHANDLDADDVARLAARGSSVVYCHGTHSHFARPRHPIVELLAAGVNVALGTDSGLSNLEVDPWTELVRLVRERPDLDPLAALRCASLGGRRALRLPEGPARFERGAPADALLVGPVPAGWEPRDARTAWLGLLEGGAGPLATLAAGRPRASADEPPAALRAFLDTVSGQG